MSLTQIMIMYIAYFGVGIILEMPSGVFADLHGRKKALFVGNLFSMLGIVGIILSPKIGAITGYFFIWFLISEIIGGVGQAFTSGADTAYLYDTLKKQKREKEFKKINGRTLSVSMVSLAAAAFLGSIVANYGLDKPFYFSVFFMGISLFIISTFKEPIHYKKLGKKDYWSHQISNLLFTLKHKKVRALSIYNGFIFSLSLIGFTFFFQLYLRHINIPISHFSYIYPTIVLFGALVSAKAYKIERFIGEKNTFLLLPFVLALSFIFMSVVKSYWGVIFIILIECVFTLVMPINNHFINKYLATKQRATVISIRNLFSSLVFIIISPIIGLIGDKVSLSASLSFTGIIALIMGGVTIVLSKEIW